MNYILLYCYFGCDLIWYIYIYIYIVMCHVSSVTFWANSVGQFNQNKSEGGLNKWWQSLTRRGGLQMKILNLDIFLNISVGADPFRWSSTSRQNLSIQQNCCNFWTNTAILIPFRIKSFWKNVNIVCSITRSTIFNRLGVTV